MPIPFSSLAKNSQKNRNYRKHLSLLIILGLTISHLFVTPQTSVTQAAETISGAFHAFNAIYESVQDTTNSPPGLVIKHSTPFGYYIEITNDSSALPASSPTATIEMPALTAFDITTGGMATFADLECTYALGTIGTANYNIDFTGSGAPCSISFLSGTNIQLTGPSVIPVGQTLYFRLRGMSSKASYGFTPFAFGAKGHGDALFNITPVTTGIPLNSFVKVAEATISGNIFYDNGPSGAADNGTKQVSEPLVTVASSVIVNATSGLQSYNGAVDSSGNYSIIVPENNEVGAIAYTISVPTVPTGFRLTSGLSSGVVLDTGGNFSLDIGINNQTDLALSINATLPPGTLVGHTAMIHVTVNNFGPTDATNVDISIPATGPNYSLFSSSPGIGNSYNSETGIWTIANLGSGSSQVFAMTINLDSAGTVDIIAEVIAMTLPVSNFGSPDQDSTPNNHTTLEDDQMNIAFVINNPTTISGFIFEDYLENQVYNGPSEDPDFPEVTVNLYDITGTPSLIDTTETDTTGHYTFSTGLVSGRSYRAEVVPPVSYVVTTNNTTQDFTVFLDGDSYSSTFVGLFHSGTISGKVFLDANHNDIRDNDEQAGIEGIVVDLIDGSGSTIASQITNEDGDYSFPNLHVSGYILQFHAFEQYTFANPHIGDPAIDSDIIAGSGYTAQLPIFSNTFLNNIDAGLHTASAELTISKVANRTEASIGDSITYTITVHNNGPLNSSGSIVTDILPNQLTYVSYTASGGIFNPSNGQWSLPEIINGTETYLQITVIANSNGLIHNIADLTTLAQPDTIAGNNSAFFDVNVSPSTSPSPTPTSSISPTPTGVPSPTPISPPNLHILKYVYVNDNGVITASTDNTNGPEAKPDRELVYLIGIENTGSGSAQNMSVIDDFPAPLSSTGWTCFYSAQDYLVFETDHDNSNLFTPCQLSSNGTITNLPTTLPGNSSIYIQLSGKTTPNYAGSICNTASVQALAISPLSDRACITVMSPQLSIQKSASTSQIIPGGTITYTLTVTNSGNIAATNVEIIDDLANSAVGTNIIPSCVLSTRQVTLLDNGHFDTANPTAASWIIGTLAAGSSTTVRLRAEIRSDLINAVTCSNTAFSSGSNVSTSQDSAVVTVPVFTPAGAVITFRKEAVNSLNNHVFNPGDHVQYRLTVTNTGTQNSELLSIQDEGNNQYLLNNTVQSSGGTIASINPLQINNLLVSGGLSHTVNYDTTIIDASHFPLSAFRLHKNADKSDKDFYPERVTRSRLRSNENNNASDILRAPDGQGVALGNRGSITVNTNRNGKLVVDGDGEDFCLATLNIQNGIRYRVSVGQNDEDTDFEELGTSNGHNNCFDLSDADIAWANYIKIEDRSSNGSLSSTNIDAICLLHLGGLVENTAELSTSTQLLAESTSTIVVNFTDIFESPVESSDCHTSKQTRVLETFSSSPLPPLDSITVQARIPEPTVETPIELPKTGTNSTLALILSSGLSGFCYYRLRRKTKKFESCPKESR